MSSKVEICVINFAIGIVDSIKIILHRNSRLSRDCVYGIDCQNCSVTGPFQRENVIGIKFLPMVILYIWHGRSEGKN
ncbi:hypothetical protein [Candidatus Liberibacter sp.]|uniref:hypothetical protein n=1 Tax=Candidatus Liberibacter sp. TaxID=34022 RepID=UPI0015F48782|nr:hypothetical protein [Candidatus Liberibacter sp.]MBA5723820.1 hypothetical protein [Candidatus Liberibacter sp.]